MGHRVIIIRDSTSQTNRTVLGSDGYGPGTKRKFLKFNVSYPNLYDASP